MRRTKILAAMLSLVFVFMLFPSLRVNAATSGTCGANGNNVTWTLEDNGTLTISGSGAMADYDDNYAPWFDICANITSIEISQGVTSIGDCAFYLCINATSVTIPNTVTSIGDSAFKLCTQLNNVTLPTRVKTIGTSAFSNCSALSIITINGTITSLGNGAFEDTALTDIPSNLITSYIPSGTFVGCEFTTITIPNTVTSIEANAFFGCDKLTSITIPNSVTSIGYNAFKNCDKLQTTNNSISIDKALYDKYDDAFPDILLTSFNFTEYTITYATATNGTVTGATATSVSGETIIPTVSPASGYIVKEVTYTNIKNTPVPITPDASGNYSFTMPSCNTTVSATFMPGGNCGKNGDNLKWTYDDATKTLTITGSGKMANYLSGNVPWITYRSDIENIVISNGVTSIGDNTFRNCPNITSATIPDSVTSIGACAYYGCTSLETISIPEVTSISQSAFNGCTSLTSITIPDNVTSLGYKAFAYCDNLTTVTMSWNEYNKLGADAISDCFQNSPVTIYFCKETLTADNGTISVESRDYTNGTITLKLDPDTNYALGSVSVKYSDGTVEDVLPNNGKYIVDVTKGDIEVNATFIPTYEIKFVNTDGTVLQSSSVPSGDTPAYTGTTPAKAEDEQYTYSFSGWTPTIVPVTGDATYTAVFTETAKSTPTPTAEPTAATTPATTPAVTTTPAPGTYYVQSIEEKDGAIVITIKRTENDDQTYELVQSIETDGKQLSVGDQIELTSGSAIITIKKDFVSTLTPGTHTMKVTFKDGGSITLEYTVKEPEKAQAAVQATGEATAITAFVGIGLILTACGLTIITVRKRKEEA